MPDDRPPAPVAVAPPAPHAMTAALHRLAGGMQTASVALHLLASHGSVDGVRSAAVARAGLRGIEAAARAKLLVTVALGSAAIDDDELPALREDVVDMLKLHARRHSVELAIDDAPSASLATPGALVGLLEHGLASIEAAEPGTLVALGTTNAGQADGIGASQG
jgi:hypothetical protein